MRVIPTVDSRSPSAPGRIILAAAVVTTAILSGRDAAAAWEITPEGTLGVRYEDNARFRADNEEEATGLLLRGRADLTWFTEQTEIRLTPRGAFSFYSDSDDEDLEDEDLYLDLRARHETQKSQFGLDAGWWDVAVRTSELADAVPDDPDDPGAVGDSGQFVIIDDSRETILIRPSWSYQLTPRNIVSAGLGYTDVSFDRDNELTGRFPYDYFNWNLAGQRILNERNSISLSIDGSQFESDDEVRGINNQTDTYSANLIYTRQMSQTLTASLSLGASTSDFDVRRTPDIGDDCLGLDDQGNLIIVPCSLDSDDSSFVGNISFRKRGERTIMNFDLGRNIFPSSDGVSVVRDTVRFYIDQNLTQLWSTRFGFLAYQQEDNGELTSREIDYVRADISFIRRLSERWSVNGRYQYTWRDESRRGPDPFSFDAEKNLVLLEVRYRGLGHRF